MKSNKTSVQRAKTFAEGGDTRMAKPQAANPQKPAVTGHAVKGGNVKRAVGGPPTRGVSLSKTAVPGHTGPVVRKR
jgi:hypothetical protein